MARLLGTTWASYVGEGQTYRVATPAIEDVAQALSAELYDQATAPVKTGKLVRHGKTLETAIFCNVSWTEGALVSIRCKQSDEEVSITVGRTSLLLRASVYIILALGVAAGLLAASVLLPATWDAVPRFAIGLLIGVVCAIPFLLALAKVPWIAGGRSRETQETLDAAIKKWVEQANVTPCNVIGV